MSKDEEQFTVPQSLPIQAFDQMATQLTVERPPVEDSDYIPDGVEELARAASAVAQQVPRDQVSSFYEKIKSALEASIADENDPETVSPAQEKEEAAEAAIESEVAPPVVESRLRSFLREQLSDWGTPDPRYDKKKKEDWEEEDAPAGRPGKDTIKGKYIAPYYDKKGPSGVNVSSDRLMQNFLAPLFEVPSEDLKDSMDYVKYFYNEHATGEEPQGSQQAFVSYVLKKVVKKELKKGSNLTQTLLPAVVQHVKEMPDKEFAQLIDKASKESSSELQARGEFADMLQKEDPEQFKLLQDLGLA